MTPLVLKNSYSKSVETFTPLDPSGKRVLIYSCGPTVYSFAHIGNFRSFLFADVLRRVLERRGHAVRHVMNITDVGHMTQDHLADASGEDKLSKAARELGSDPYTVAMHFERAFVADAKTLRLKNYLGAEADEPALHPRATRHVPEMLAMIQRLVERGFAYVVPSGEVYFEVAKFPDYGKLSGKVLDDLEAGARVAVRDEKKDPRDFALWKVDDKHLMHWDPHSPAGWPEGDWERYRALAPNGIDKRIRPGFPGWHIECSAMSQAHLGERIDIHTGGEDNVFPHHECEIAQSHGAASDPSQPGPFARYWVHGRHLLVDGKKMSKRDGTFFTVRDLLDPRAEGREDLAKSLEALGFLGGKVPPNVLRYALISNAYTQPMNFTFDLLAQSKSSVERLQSRFDRVREEARSAHGGTLPPASGEIHALLEKQLAAFDAALADDLGTGNALAAVFDLISALNQSTLSAADAFEAMRAIDAMDAVLDVLDRRVRSGVVSPERLAVPADEKGVAPGAVDAESVETLVRARQTAKKAKDFPRADAIRDDLKRRGVTLEDTPKGVRWKID